MDRDVDGVQSGRHQPSPQVALGQLPAVGDQGDIFVPELGRPTDPGDEVGVEGRLVGGEHHRTESHVVLKHLSGHGRGQAHRVGRHGVATKVTRIVAGEPGPHVKGLVTRLGLFHALDHPRTLTGRQRVRSEPSYTDLLSPAPARWWAPHVGPLR